MASNRHLGRIVALQTLYELDFRAQGLKTIPLEKLLKRNLRPYREQIDDIDFVGRLVRGVDQEHVKLDAVIAPVAPEWPVDQIARIDKVVLRIAIWELHHEAATPPKVIINEAVELAKGFGGDASPKFVNGVLGTVYKQLAAEGVRPDEPDEKKE
jgi:N utilization substance protein B